MYFFKRRHIDNFFATPCTFKLKLGTYPLTCHMSWGYRLILTESTSKANLVACPIYTDSTLQQSDDDAENIPQNCISDATILLTVLLSHRVKRGKYRENSPFLCLPMSKQDYNIRK